MGILWAAPLQIWAVSLGNTIALYRLVSTNLDAGMYFLTRYSNWDSSWGVRVAAGTYSVAAGWQNIHRLFAASRWQCCATASAMVTPAAGLLAEHVLDVAEAKVACYAHCRHQRSEAIAVLEHASLASVSHSAYAGAAGVKLMHYLLSCMH